MKTILFLLAICSSLTIFAQREDHKWYFSDTNIGLFFDYNTNAASITHEHVPMNYAGAYSVACDNITGQLMYYTDGSKIWDKNHLVMPNGSGLNNALHSIQTGVTCYYPGHPNHFFIFNTTNDVTTIGNIYYTEIDLSLPGNGTVVNPSGDVVVAAKNVFLADQSTEGLKIISGMNCYWLIAPQINSSNVRVFKIDNTGVTLSNTYNLGLSVGTVSYTEYSPVSHKLAIGNFNGDESSLVMDFNETTGQISNSLAIPGTSFYGSGVTAVEWSPSGQLLYLTRYRNSLDSTSGELLQYNTNTPSTSAIVIATMLPSSNSNGSKGLKLGPDGKIYHVWGLQSNTYLGTINNPDLAGLACNYNPLSLNMGQALNYLHTLSESLLPPVCENITVNDVTICAGQSATLTASGAASYVWSNQLGTGYQQVVSPITTTSYIVTGTSGTCVTSDTATVTVNQNPTPVISGSLSYCSGASATLDAGAGYTGYIWSTGASSQTISATIANNPVTVNVFDANGCMGTSDPVSLTENSSPAINGTVEYSGGFIGIGDATVRLFEFGTNGNHNLIDSVSVGLNGSFSLQNFPEGLYYVHVKLDNNSGYQHVHNTYYDSTFQWLDATLFNMQCGMDTSIEIHMFETGPTLLGNGHMNGTVTLFSGNKAAGIPVSGAEVLMMQESNNVPLQSVYTDNEGNYSFTGIPEDSYTMYIDIPGLPMVQTYSGITVTATDTLFENLNFYIDTTDVTAGIYTSDLNAVTLITTPDFSIELYPNPVKTDFNIEYTLIKQSNVNIEMIDITGKSTVVENGEMSEGKHKNNFNTEKLGLSSGIYLLKFTFENNVYTKKMVIQ